MKTYLLAIAFSVVTVGLANAQPISNWTNTGPVLFPVNVSGQVDGMGRTCQLKFHPTNPAKIYAVSASGGLYISTDTGHHWTVTPGTETMPGNQCSSVCIDYTNDMVIYLSTGDPDYYYEDYGIWKSTNGGLTFSPANTGIGNRMAVEIIMDPANHNRLIAATDNGIWKTTDGAVTWTQQLAGGNFRNMKMRPGSHHVLYAVTDSSYFMSTDTGNTWTRITSGISVPVGNGGMRLGVSAADTNVVYIGTTDSYGLIMKSVDGGLNFSTIYSSTTQCLVCYDSTTASGSQGDYNFCLTVNPDNANELLLGSHCVWRSTDGGYTWSWRTQWWNQIHTDMHDIQFDPYNTNLRFDANDGGVWSSYDPQATVWQPRSDGLSATEMYHAAQAPLQRQMISAGTQDNGELYYDGNWKCNRGGDWGAACAIGYGPNATVYYAGSGSRRDLAPLGGDYSFNCPFTPDNGVRWEFSFRSHNTVFAGKDTLYRTQNIGDGVPTWQTIYPLSGTSIMAIAVSKADSNLAFFVTDDNHIYRSLNATAASPTFTMLTAPASTWITASITTIRDNVNIVYLSCGGSIYRSTDKGSTWTNITGSLPGLNIVKIISDDYSSTERIFLYEGGYFFYKDNTTSTWSTATGLPTICQYTDLMVYNDSTSTSVIRLSSYGRGVWESNIQPTMPPSGDFSSDKQYLCMGDTVHYHKSTYGNPTAFSWSFPGGTPSTSTLDSPVVNYASSGTYNAYLYLSGPTGNDTIVKTSYIVVSNGVATALHEGFEEAVFPPGPDWTQLSESGVFWQHNTTYGGFGLTSSSVMFDNYDNDCQGHHDRFLTPKIDLTTTTAATLYFDVAYAYYPGYRDSLSVEVSTDCGRTFTSIYLKDTSYLATTPDTTGSFTPGPGEWRTDSINLNTWTGNSIIIAFDNIGHYGQNLYLDNININFIPLNTSTPEAASGLTVYPIPANDILHLVLKGNNGQTIYYNIYNTLGALVDGGRLSIGNETGELPVSRLAPGLYMLSVQSENGARVQKAFLRMQ